MNKTKKKIIKKLLPIINTWCKINPIIRNKYMLLSVLYDSVLREIDRGLSKEKTIENLMIKNYLEILEITKGSKKIIYTSKKKTRNL